MAIAKIHPIKLHLKKAIEYICNPEKTDGELLISSYKCNHKTADLEFKSVAKNSMEKGNNLAHHLIQSFAIDDNLTPDEAHDIGMKFARSVLGDNYQFVLTTHIDKGHIHNHIMFNAVDTVDYKKYISNKKTLKEIRNINDTICLDNNLSVIDNFSNNKSYLHWKTIKSTTTYKSKIKDTIDNLIEVSNSYEDFLRNMNELGYEVKTTDKHTYFKAPNQKKYTKAKTIGYAYNQHSISSRIYKNNLNKNKKKNENNIKDLIDTSTTKMQENIHLKTWATGQNLSAVSKSLLALQQNNLTIDTLNDKINEKKDTINNTRERIKNIESEMHNLDNILNKIDKHINLRPLYVEYKNNKKISSNHAREFFAKNNKELNLFLKLEHELLSLGIRNSEDIHKLKNKYQSLNKEINGLYDNYYKDKEDLKKMSVIENNLNKYISNSDTFKSKNIDGQSI